MGKIPSGLRSLNSLERRRRKPIPEFCERCGERMVRRTIYDCRSGIEKRVIGFCPNYCKRVTAAEREILELATECHGFDPDWNQSEVNND